MLHFLNTSLNYEVALLLRYTLYGHSRRVLAIAVMPRIKSESPTFPRAPYNLPTGRSARTKATNAAEAEIKPAGPSPSLKGRTR